MSTKTVTAPLDTNDPAVCLDYAKRIATGLFKDNYAYRGASKTWATFEDLWGVLSQIDNMVCGMVRGTPKQIEAASEKRRIRIFKEAYPQTPKASAPGPARRRRKVS